MIDLKNKKRLVIKIGSSLLWDGKKVREKWLQSLAKDVSTLSEKGFEIIITTSGAIAIGKQKLSKNKNKFSLPEKQAAASIGQIELMTLYQKAFKKYNFEVAQILLTASDCNSRQRYLNCQNTIETLLKNNVIPIINENDSIAVDEIKVGDNDRLSARVAQMSSAQLLILFSDIDGLYNCNPKTNKNAKLIKEVFVIDKTIEDMAQGASSEVGTGGMITKIMAAKMLEDSGCDVAIGSGIAENPLQKIIAGKGNSTIFYSKKNVKNQRQKWLSGLLNLNSGIVVNNCAVIALRAKKISILPIGIVEVIGNFKAGEAIAIFDEAKNRIAGGISNYSSFDVARIMQKNSNQVKEIIGQTAKVSVVHIDNLSVF